MLDTALDAEYFGIWIDLDKLRENSKILLGKSKVIKDEIEEEIGTGVNIDSPEQLGAYLQKQGWPAIRMLERGYATGEEELVEWEKMGYALAPKLVRYRKLMKLIGSYMGEEEEQSGMWKHIRRHSDGSHRVHSHIKVAMAGTHRNQSAEPNIFQFPKRGDEAHLVREIITTPPGYKIVEWDLAGLQLRLCAIMSDCTAMREAFLDKSTGGDLHSITGNQIFCPHIDLQEFLKHKKEKPYSDYRQKSKAINFGLIFGTSAVSFARDSLRGEWTEDECLDYISKNKLDMQLKGAVRDIEEGVNNYCPLDLAPFWIVARDLKKKFFNTYPEVQKWIENSGRFALEHGYIKSFFGAVRRLPILKHSGIKDPRQISGAEKTYYNMTANAPIQGFEVGVMFRATNDLRKYLRERNMKSVIVNFIYDSCIPYVHDDEMEEVLRVGKDFFERELVECLGVPMVADHDVFDPRRGIYW